jgi:hypothetical protein
VTKVGGSGSNVFRAALDGVVASHAGSGGKDAFGGGGDAFCTAPGGGEIASNTSFGGRATAAYPEDNDDSNILPTEMHLLYPREAAGRITLTGDSKICQVLARPRPWR